MGLLHRKNQLGFTLLEIIVAISIIAIFTVLPVLAYSSYQKKARDEKRKTDVTKISQALESYKAEKGVYPPNLDALVDSGYLPELPVDPLQGKDIPWDEGALTFGYSFSSEDGTSYTLSTPLELGGATGSNGSVGGGANEGGGSVFVVTPSNPGGGVVPVAVLTEQAQNPTAPPPTKTPYLTQVPLGSITATPLPTNTPTHTPTPSDTPSATPTTLPDLDIENLTSDSYGYYAQYCNRGNNATGQSFSVSLKYNGAGGTTYVMTGPTVPPINTCANTARFFCQDIGMPFPYCASGGSLTATADSANTVQELNEVNNTYSKTMPSYTPTPTPSAVPCVAYQGHFAARPDLESPLAMENALSFKSLLPKFQVSANDGSFESVGNPTGNFRLLAQRVTSTNPPRAPIDIYASGTADAFGRKPHMEFWHIYTDSNWITHETLLARWCNVNTYGAYRWNAGANNDYFSIYDQIYVSTYNGGSSPSSLPTVTNPGTLNVDKMVDTYDSTQSSTTTNAADWQKRNCYYWNGSSYVHSAGPSQQLQCVGSNYSTNKYNWMF